MQTKYQDRLKELNAVLLNHKQVEWFARKTLDIPYFTLIEDQEYFGFEFDLEWTGFSKGDVLDAQKGTSLFAVRQRVFNLLPSELRNAN